MMQFGHFSIKFLESDQYFFIKIEVVNKADFLYWCNWYNPSVNFGEKYLFQFKKFNEKDQIASILEKSRSNWD